MYSILEMGKYCHIMETNQRDRYATYDKDMTAVEHTLLGTENLTHYYLEGYEGILCIL